MDHLKRIRSFLVILAVCFLHDESFYRTHFTYATLKKLCLSFLRGQFLIQTIRQSLFQLEDYNLPKENM